MPLTGRYEPPRVGDYTAREVTGAERDDWWART